MAVRGMRCGVQALHARCRVEFCAHTRPRSKRKNETDRLHTQSCSGNNVRMPSGVGNAVDDYDEPGPATRSSRPLSQKKILLVDDEPDAVESMAAVLREDGYVVDCAGTAEDALERFRSETYHLLITDLFLPGKSG